MTMQEKNLRAYMPEPVTITLTDDQVLVLAKALHQMTPSQLGALVADSTEYTLLLLTRASLGTSADNIINRERAGRR